MNLLKLSEKALRPADPNAIAPALESRCMGVIRHDLADFVIGKVALVTSEVNFGQLDFGARVGMALGNLLPDFERRVSFVEGGEGLGESHQRIPVIMFRVFGDDAFEKRARLRWTFQAKEALAKMGASIDVLRIAFERGAVTGLGLVEFALLEINVAQLEVVMWFVEVMNLRLEFFYAATLLGAGQFKAARGRN